MPNENDTEATREDALNTYESLFGDASADQTVTVANEEADKNETEQGQQDSEIGEDQTGGDETAPPEDLKVVVSIKDGRATIGVQRPSSDPHIEPVDGLDLSGLTQEVLAVVERARAKWEDEPKYPAHERPAASTRRRPRREQGSAQDSTAEEEAAQDQLQSRLF